MFLLQSTRDVKQRLDVLELVVQRGVSVLLHHLPLAAARAGVAQHPLLHGAPATHVVVALEPAVVVALQALPHQHRNTVGDVAVQVGRVAAQYMNEKSNNNY